VFNVQSVQCSEFNEHCWCSVFCVYFSVFSIIVQCSVSSVQCSMFNVQCSEFNELCSVFSVQCLVFSVKCSCVQCSVVNINISIAIIFQGYINLIFPRHLILNM